MGVEEEEEEVEEGGHRRTWAVLGKVRCQRKPVYQSYRAQSARTTVRKCVFEMRRGTNT